MIRAFFEVAPVGIFILAPLVGIFIWYSQQTEIIMDGIYWHQCEEPGCEVYVEFDDEPKCFKHSPDSGSDVPGYSARAKDQHND